MNINIEDFSLINFISSVETIPFYYASIEGIADCLGYYIICFKERNSDFLSAINFEDILPHKELTEIANHILQTLCIPIRFGDNSHLVASTLGTLSVLMKTFLLTGKYGIITSMKEKDF